MNQNDGKWVPIPVALREINKVVDEQVDAPELAVDGDDLLCTIWQTKQYWSDPDKLVPLDVDDLVPLCFVWRKAIELTWDFLEGVGDLRRLRGHQHCASTESLGRDPRQVESDWYAYLPAIWATWDC